MRRSPGRSGRRLGPADLRPRCARRRRRAAATATGPSSSSTRRPGPTSTAARASRSSRCARNGDATGGARPAVRDARVDLIVVSTNEVFDGDATRRRRLRPGRPARARQRRTARSKLAGEARRGEAFEGGGAGAARSASSGRRGCSATGQAGLPGARSSARPDGGGGGRAAARWSTDEVGYADLLPDLADAIVELLAVGGLGGHPPRRQRGIASRAEWARDVLEAARHRRRDRGDLARGPRAAPSTPPRWGVLEPSALPGGPLRPWREAMVDRMARAEVTT